jgi:hypothetical protein
MGVNDIEHLPYNGEPPQDRFAHQQYLADLKRGKSLIQLKAVASEMTPDVRQSWSVRSFTSVSTPEGNFDAIVCNASYHYNKHGSKYGSIRLMTQQAKRYFQQHRHQATPNGFGLLKLPNGSLYETDGRIVTFVG